jgi:2'-hydroxyisoflavone reductase
LKTQGGGGFPIWVPHRGQTRGFHTRGITRAVNAGLTFRPYRQTVSDTLAWYKAQPADGRTRLAGPAPAKEAELLAAWKKDNSTSGR